MIFLLVAIRCKFKLQCCGALEAGEKQAEQLKKVNLGTRTLKNRLGTEFNSKWAV